MRVWHYVKTIQQITDYPIYTLILLTVSLNSALNYKSLLEITK